MRIAEIFSSRQGEGVLTGTPSVFVRASGCNLRCWFCDTPYTSWQPEGDNWSVEQIVAEVARLRADVRHVVITGGEPMLYAELVPLCEHLKTADLHITIETAGTVDQPVACDLMSISPKLASSTPPAAIAGEWTGRHERDRHQPDVIRRLIADYEYQLKFVIDTPADCEAVQQWLAEFPQADRSRVLLMPQGIELTTLGQMASWLEPYCEQHGFVFCPRKHIEWYGATRGT